MLTVSGAPTSGETSVESISMKNSRKNTQRKLIGSSSRSQESRRVGWASDPQTPPDRIIHHEEATIRDATFSGKKPLAKLKQRSRKVEPLIPLHQTDFINSAKESQEVEEIVSDDDSVIISTVSLKVSNSTRIRDKLTKNVLIIDPKSEVTESLSESRDQLLSDHELSEQKSDGEQMSDGKTVDSFNNEENDSGPLLHGNDLDSDKVTSKDQEDTRQNHREDLESRRTQHEKTNSGSDADHSDQSESDDDDTKESEQDNLARPTSADDVEQSDDAADKDLGEDIANDLQDQKNFLEIDNASSEDSHSSGNESEWSSKDVNEAGGESKVVDIDASAPDDHDTGSESTRSDIEEFTAGGESVYTSQEDDTQSTTPSQDIDVPNEGLLNHFGEKMENSSVLSDLEIVDVEEDPEKPTSMTSRPSADEESSEVSDNDSDDEAGDQIHSGSEQPFSPRKRKERITSIDRNIQVDELEVLLNVDQPCLPKVTLEATVKDIITKIKTKACLEERRVDHQKPDKYDFASFNWKPDSEFFQFATPPNEDEQDVPVFKFEPASNPTQGLVKKKMDFRSSKAKNINKLRASGLNYIHKS